MTELTNEEAVLKARVADLIHADPQFSGARQEAMMLGDAILALPELADALKLKTVKPLNLGPSISTNKRTPV